MNDKVLMETKQISDDLTHQLFISRDEKTLFLDVNFMQGRFKIEKSFHNCIFGLTKLGIVREELDSEAKVFRYLRIGEKTNVSES